MQPRPHQIEALAAIERLPPEGRGLVVMACGTGKTLVARRAAQKRAGKDGIVMLLVPSKELLRQTYLDWQCDTDGGVDGLLVYSDASVGTADATTDPRDIARFLRTDTGRLRLLLCTYQSAARVTEAYQQHEGLPPLDVMILDEAHRTAGAGGKAYAQVLNDAQIPARQRIALTATARIHPEGDGTADVVSMDNPELYGERIYELGFGKAIKFGLLSDFRVAVVVVTDTDVHRVLREQEGMPRGDEMTTSQVAAQIAVARAVEEYGLRRLIAFHSRVERSRLFSETLHRAAARITQVPIQSLNVVASTSADERRAALQVLADPADGGAAVLSNVAVLTEGVDVPAVDSVVFADPKTSKIAIVQAIGRALRLHPEKNRPSIIVLPVYLAPGESAEQVLASSEFRHVWAVMSSLRDFDERMDTAFTTARTELGEQDFKGEQRRANLPDAIDILGETTILQGQLEDALRLHLVEGATESWLDKYGQLKAYMEFTHAMPPSGYATPSGSAIGAFAMQQKALYRKGKLLRSRVEMLEQLPGWKWGKAAPKYKKFDVKAVEKLVQEFAEVAGGDDSKARTRRMDEIAVHVEQLMPGFKYPQSKFVMWYSKYLWTMEARFKSLQKAGKLEAVREALAKKMPQPRTAEDIQAQFPDAKGDELIVLQQLLKNG
ncbi:DEAD/DEAH box helicase family protein [Streptomyces yangpuensis]